MAQAVVSHVGAGREELSKTQLRRQQRLHSQQSYQSLKFKLLSVVQPLPAAPEATRLEEFRGWLFAPGQEFSPCHAAAAISKPAFSKPLLHECQWCGVLAPVRASRVPENQSCGISGHLASEESEPQLAASVPLPSEPVHHCKSSTPLHRAPEPQLPEAAGLQSDSEQHAIAGESCGLDSKPLQRAPEQVAVIGQARSGSSSQTVAIDTTGSSELVAEPRSKEKKRFENAPELEQPLGGVVEACQLSESGKEEVAVRSCRVSEQLAESADTSVPVVQPQPLADVFSAEWWAQMVSAPIPEQASLSAGEPAADLVVYRKEASRKQMLEGKETAVADGSSSSSTSKMSLLWAAGIERKSNTDGSQSMQQQQPETAGRAVEVLQVPPSPPPEQVEHPAVGIPDGLKAKLLSLGIRVPADMTFEQLQQEVERKAGKPS